MKYLSWRRTGILHVILFIMSLEYFLQPPFYTAATLTKRYLDLEQTTIYKYLKQFF